MVEFAEDLLMLLTNIFKPAQVVRYACDDQSKKMNVFVSDKNDVGIAIGKGGCTIEKARLLIRRYYGYEVGEVFPEEGVA